ncbi:MAG: hypothetical protein D6791_05760, partial [Chloroflexi bacterium]
RRISLVFGASIDKRIDDMLEVLLSAASRLILTQARHPRAAPPALLRELVHRRGYCAEVVPAVADALAVAAESATEGELILVTGSLFVVAEARMAWFQLTGRPLPPHDPFLNG